MDKLVNYGSDEDDDCEESPRLERPETKDHEGSRHSKAMDVNYDEVEMDLSEDSERPVRPDDHRNKRDRDRDRRRDKKESPKSRYREDKSDYDEDRYKDRHRRDRDEGRDRERDDKSDFDEDRYKDRHRRDRDEVRDRIDRDEKSDHDDDRYKDRHRRDRDDGRDRDDRNDRDRDRYDRRHRRSSSRDRNRSRSPRRRRSGSRERGGSKYGGYSRRYDKASNKMAHLEKMGIELKPSNNQYSSSDGRNEQKGGVGGDKFFLPGVTGRLREQMERRKLLWQKKEPEKTPGPNISIAGSSKSEKVWESTTFAQDQDGKQASKFKRLMGIKDTSMEGQHSAPDIIKKQEELFSSMEQQYEVARTATHTMRGVGLGFGSFQR